MRVRVRRATGVPAEMRILVVGDWHSELHEQAVFDVLVELGHEVEAFAWHRYFKARGRLGSLFARVQNRFVIGPALARLNRDVIELTGEQIRIYLDEVFGDRLARHGVAGAHSDPA